MGKLIFKSHKGFSLIELLITITILVITATAVLPVLTFVTKANNQNKVRSTANSIATGIFEEISSMQYEDIGTASGSPTGTVVTPRTVTVDGIDYKVDIYISWGSATDLGTEKKVNPVAFKNIRVIVKAIGVFTGTEDTIDKMYSIVAKEGQQSIPDKGNIRATIKKGDNEFLTSPSLSIKAAGPITYNVVTEGGQAIFGEIEKGTYSVSAPIPSGYYVPQGETVESGNAVRNNIIIDSWSVRDVYFYMDTLDNYSKLSIKLIDESGEVIAQPGKIAMSWNMDGKDFNIFSDRSFSNGNITPEIIDRLWPLGTYNIKISFPDSEGYIDYDMSTSGDKPVIEDTGALWNGTFSEVGETINLLIPIASKPSIITRDAFSILEAESYDSSSREFTESSEDGGQIIRGMSSNNYSMYQNVDFDTGANLFIARASSTSNRTITLRVDSVNGPIIGILNFRQTGYYSPNYQEQSSWVNGITGIHDLYLVYSGDLRFNWFTFKRSIDDFNDNYISSAWTFYNGAWAENQGVLKQTSTGAQDPKKAILSNGGFDQSTNYTIKAKVWVQQWSDSDEARAGVSLFSSTSNGYGYNLLFHNNKNTVQFLDDMRGWSTQYAFSWQTQKWYWFKLKSEGRKMYGKIWQDGSSEPGSWLFEYTFTFTPQRTGYPSLNGGSGNTQVWFDDVSVSQD